MVALIPLADATEAQIARALALNARDVEMLSPLDRTAFEALVDVAFAAWILEDGGGFLIAVSNGADYQSANYQWFAERLDRFVYVDRIVVAEEARGQGVARTLYAALTAAARAAGAPIIAAEVNVTPPNPASHAFHLALGFEPIADGATPDGRKTVRYYQKSLEADTSTEPAP